MKLKVFFLTLLALPLGGMAVGTQQNIVRFSVEVEQELDTDVMQVLLYTQEESKELKSLNKQMSERMNFALSEVKKQPAVQVKSQNAYTQVRYGKNGKADGWIVRHEVVLQSKDFENLSQLINGLSDKFAIGNIDSTISAEKFAQKEDELTRSLLQKYQQKAQFIQQSLQAKGYQLVELALSHHNQANYSPRAMYAAEMKMSSSEPLVLQGGKSKIKAMAEVQIQLVND